MTCSLRLQSSADFLTAALAASDVVVVINDDGVISDASPAIERVLGHPPSNWRRRSLLEFVHDDDRDGLLDLLAAVAVQLPGRPPIPVRVRAAHANGGWVDLEASHMETMSNPEPSGVVVVLRDVRDRAEAERDLDRARAELVFAASHDTVTGLPNRRQLEHALGTRRDGRAPEIHLVMAKVADIDGLRDRYGTVESAAILRSLGDSIRRIAGEANDVAVDGPGEFVVVIGLGTTADRVDRLCHALLTLSDTPVSSRCTRVDLRIAVGRAILEPDRPVSVSLDQLGQAARTTSATDALAPVVFGEARRSAVSERRRLAADVERGLAGGEFELHYQPIRDVRSGRVASFEGLLRWNHPRDGIVNAADFLPAVEGTALMIDIGDLVLAAGCAQLANWQRRYRDRAPSLALNVSARQLRQGDFVIRLCAELARAGADPHGLCLELTETHALEREPRALAELERIRETGARIALDDFGTGYSSLHQLQKIAADELKVDRAFITNVGIDEGATAIVRAAIELGSAFGMTTVAEGVTTIEQHRLLLAMGCDRIQGFLIAPALPADLAEALLAQAPADDPSIGTVDGAKHGSVVQAQGTLAGIDTGYHPSEEEVAALAGVTALDARRGLTRSALVSTARDLTSARRWSGWFR